MTSSRVLRTALGVLLTLVLLFAGAVLFVYFYDWNHSRAWISEKISSAIEREFDIHGDLSVAWKWPLDGVPGWQRWIPSPLIRAGDVRIGNPTGFTTTPASAEPSRFAQVGRADVALALAPLLWRHFDIRSVKLSNPDVKLIRNADGSNNWTFGQSQDGQSRWTVSLGSLGIDQGRLGYRDAITKLNVLADLASLAPEDTENGRYGIGFKLSGEYGKAEVKGGGKAGQLLSLRNERLDYPLKFDATAGRLGARAEGIIENPRALSGLDFRVFVKAASMADLFQLTGLVLPNTPPFETEGHLVGTLKPDGATWSYDNFSGSIGESDLQGHLKYASAKPRPRLTGKISSRQLRLSDLGPLIGKASDSEPKKKSNGKVLPDDPFATDRWDKMDLDIEYEATRIIRPKSVPIDSLRTHAKLEDSRLRLTPLDFGVAKGRIKSEVTLDANSKPLRASVHGNVRGLQLSALFPKIELMKKSLGSLDGGLHLDGQGNSIAKLLGSAQGEVKLYVRDGVMSKQLLDLAGLNIGSVLVSKLFGTDEEVHLRCAIADVPIVKGVAHARNVKINTDDALIEITGTADLAREQADLDVNPKAYSLKLFSLRTPLEIRGPFANAHVGVKPGPLILRAAAAAVAVAAAPVALALVPITVPGVEDDAGCAPLLANSRVPIGKDQGKNASANAPTEGSSSASNATPPQPASGEFSAGTPKR